MNFLKKSWRTLLGTFIVSGGLCTAALADSPWDLQAVDETGQATHSKVGAEVTEANKVVVEGIALNATGDYLSTATMWQTYIQAEGPDQGGIAAFSAIFYDNSQWPRYPMDIQSGDRVRVEGYTEFHNGKTNINERHSASPDLRMTVTKLTEGAGMPAPQTIFELAGCNGFDATRATGGEYFQCQWVELQNVTLDSGAWSAGENVIVRDDAGSTLTVLLAGQGAFTTAPSGAFNVRGIFDQEDTTSPYTADYRLWVRNQDAVIEYPGGDSIWALQAVDSDGNATSPKAGTAVSAENKVVIEGIALNAPGEILNTGQMWQVYVQGEGEDTGGVAVFAAIFYDNSQWPRYPEDIQAGDRIRVEGYAAAHNGKTNINERHSASPDLRMTITTLEAGAGMPAPRRIESIANCNYFDPRRVGGGERYQGMWVQLDDVEITSGTWQAGQTLTITDASGQTLPMLLSSQGDFDQRSAPTGSFSVRGIFDQEDETAPTTGNYRLWVKSYADLTQPTAAGHWNQYR